jgi:hypothetical protein
MDEDEEYFTPGELTAMYAAAPRQASPIVATVDALDGLMDHKAVLAALGVSRQRLHAIRFGRRWGDSLKAPDERFPQPVCTLNGGPVWRAQDIATYVDRRTRDNELEPPR